MTEANQL